MHTTTLNQISQLINDEGSWLQDPIETWEKLLKHVNAFEPNDNPITFRTIYEAIGDEVFWAVGVLPINERVWMGCQFIMTALDFTVDDKVQNQVKMCVLFLEGRATEEMLQHCKMKNWPAMAADWSAAKHAKAAENDGQKQLMSHAVKSAAERCRKIMLEFVERE